jgi:hypothetical protein
MHERGTESQQQQQQPWTLVLAVSRGGCKSGAGGGHHWVSTESMHGRVWMG